MESMPFEEQVKMMKETASVSAKVIPSSDDAIAALFEKVAAGEVETVIASEIDRLGINSAEAKKVLSKLKECGVQVIDTKGEDISSFSSVTERTDGFEQSM